MHSKRLQKSAFHSLYGGLLNVQYGLFNNLMADVNPLELTQALNAKMVTGLRQTLKKVTATTSPAAVMAFFMMFIRFVLSHSPQDLGGNLK